jgi:hypothetical protein
MKKMLCLLLLATSGCYYQAHTVRRAYPTDPPLSPEEIERLSSAGVSEAVIIEMIGKRGAMPLTPDDLVALKKAGTPDTVVQMMIASERKPPQAAGPEEAAYPVSYYYYDYPYFYSSFSYGWGWGWGYSHYYPRGYMGVRIYR